MNNNSAFSFFIMSIKDLYQTIEKTSREVRWRWVCDRKGVFLKCYEQVLDITGYSSTFLLNKPITTGVLDTGSQKAIITALSAKLFPFTVQVLVKPYHCDPIEMIYGFLGFRELIDDNGWSSRQNIGRSFFAFAIPGEKTLQDHVQLKSDLSFNPKLESKSLEKSIKTKLRLQDQE